MQLVIEGLSKKYPKNKLFEDFSYTFESDNVYAITGENGSGKSTFMKIIAGVIPASKGTVSIFENKKKIDKDNIHQILGITAPYLQLIEEFTLKEHLEFHSKFKKLLVGINLDEEIERANLSKSINKNVQEFSSGMQQRLKLILSCCYSSEILLLDEPTSHLDIKGIAWYKDLIKRTKQKRMLLIASNELDEYNDFAKKIINIGSYLN